MKYLRNNQSCDMKEKSFYGNVRHDGKDTFCEFTTPTHHKYYHV